jgi:prepilin-type N-terminal cleavage/methylation domain-containing protein
MKRMAKVLGLRAFTLIELLAVIAIIGLLSALVLGLSGTATTKSREARIRGEHARLLSDIESYKAEVGTYPPDNTDTNKFSNNYERAGRNSLFYELSGATFRNNAFVVVGKNETIATTVLKENFGVDGVQNSSRKGGEIPFRGVSFKPDQYKELQPVNNDPNLDVEVLVVPIKAPSHVELDARGNKGKLNPWLYDASSTNRHNPETFDLWTEYLAKKRTNVFGNWKE